MRRAASYLPRSRREKASGREAGPSDGYTGYVRQIKWDSWDGRDDIERAGERAIVDEWAEEN